MDLKINKNKPFLPEKILLSLPADVRNYIHYLRLIIEQQQITIEQQHEQQQAQIQQLQVRISQLEARLLKDSSNSSKPPSSDGLKRKPKSLREKSGKKPGGQLGHTGKGLTPVPNPDIIISHTSQACHACGLDLSQQEGTCYESRQVFDISLPKVEVSEHRALKKRCPKCGSYTRAPFPQAVKGLVQYGERVQALKSYLMDQHFIPVDRTCQIFNDIFNLPISSGACMKMGEHLFNQLAGFNKNLKAYLLSEPVLHLDETGTRCNKKNYWTHVACTSRATLYHFHVKRGQEAIDSMGILPNFTGIAVHDEWQPYFSYNQDLHALCNAHLLRELTFIHEQEKEAWAKQMKDLLISAKQEVEKHLEVGKLADQSLLQIEKRYQHIISEGIEYHKGLPPLAKGKRGKQKQRAGKNLLDRLGHKQEYVLRFTKDFSVPFTNNQSEQDIRMIKVKQKVSGCFRTQEGGEIFCRIRSYLSTARKQGWDILEALKQAIRGDPYLLNSL